MQIAKAYFVSELYMHTWIQAFSDDEEVSEHVYVYHNATIVSEESMHVRNSTIYVLQSFLKVLQ